MVSQIDSNWISDSGSPLLNKLYMLAELSAKRRKLELSVQLEVDSRTSGRYIVNEVDDQILVTVTVPDEKPQIEYVLAHEFCHVIASSGGFSLRRDQTANAKELNSFRFIDEYTVISAIIDDVQSLLPHAIVHAILEAAKFTGAVDSHLLQGMRTPKEVGCESVPMPCAEYHLKYGLYLFQSKWMERLGLPRLAPSTYEQHLKNKHWTRSIEIAEALDAELGDVQITSPLSCVDATKKLCDLIRSIEPRVDINKYFDFSSSRVVVPLSEVIDELEHSD